MHTMQRAGYGGGYSYASAAPSWWGEYSDYTFSTNGCAAGKACGHYTQMAWATTTKLGCVAQPFSRGHRRPVRPSLYTA